MIKSTNTKWFTLVELIIVITILAILATIAFISFQGYSKEARNSKRASDLNSIVRAIEIKTGADGVEIMNFAKDDTSNVASANISLGGKTTVTPNEYKAGDINFTVLGNVDGTSFKDPQQGNYKIWVTSLAGWAYQLAAIQESEGWTQAYVVGTYKGRTAWDTATGSVTSNILTLNENTGLWLFKKGDIITVWSTDVEVISVSSDLSRLTLSWTISNAADQSIVLDNAPEQVWLVGTSGGIAIQNGNTTNLPY